MDKIIIGRGIEKKSIFITNIFFDSMGLSFHIVYEKNMIVNSIDISTESAIEIGFINPDVILNYIKNKRS